MTRHCSTSVACSGPGSCSCACDECRSARGVDATEVEALLKRWMLHRYALEGRLKRAKSKIKELETRKGYEQAIAWTLGETCAICHAKDPKEKLGTLNVCAACFAKRGTA